MHFNTLVNTILLNEEGLSDREKRIETLKSMSTNSFRVLEVAEGRGHDIVHDEVVQGSNIEEVAEEEMAKAKQSTIDHFVEEEGAEGLMNANDYIRYWFEGPVYNEDKSQSQFNFSEEGYVVILSSSSKYFDYSQGELYDNWREMSNEVIWG